MQCAVWREVPSWARQSLGTSEPEDPCLHTYARFCAFLSKFPFAGQKFVLQNLVVEYLQIPPGDFASPHFGNRGLC